MSKPEKPDTSQLYGRIPKELKEKFDAACKVRGVKKQHVLERLADMWVKGEIKID